MIEVAIHEPQRVFAGYLRDLLVERGIAVVPARPGIPLLVDLDAARADAAALDALGARHPLCGLAIDPGAHGVPFPVVAKRDPGELARVLGEIAGAPATSPASP